MPLDPRIPLMAQPIQMPDFNALAVQRQGMQQNALAMQMQQAQLSQAQRAEQAQQAALARRQQVGGMAAKGDFKGAQSAALEGGDTELYSAIHALSTEQRKEAAERNKILGAVALSIAELPYEQRMQAIKGAEPYLSQVGIDPEQIAQFDPTDENIAGIVSTTQSIGDILEQRNKDRDFRLEGEKFGHTKEQDAAELAFKEKQMKQQAADEAAGRSVTIRGQNISRENAFLEKLSSADKERRAGAKDTATLRKEFNALPEVKDFKDVRANYMQIKNLASKAKASPQDDVALVFSFMKMLDPGSVVREAEYATAQNAAGVPDRIRNQWNRLIDGDKLNPRQRAEMANTARGVYEPREKTYNDRAAEYQSYASDLGIAPTNVAKRYLPPAKKATPPNATPAPSGWGKAKVVR